MIQPFGFGAATVDVFPAGVAYTEPAANSSAIPARQYAFPFVIAKTYPFPSLFEAHGLLRLLADNFSLNQSGDRLFGEAQLIPFIGNAICIRVLSLGA